MDDVLDVLGTVAEVAVEIAVEDAILDFFFD